MDNCLIRTKTPNGYMAVLKDGWRFDDSQIVEAPTLAELELKLATARFDDWKTINGAHVLIGKTGRILGGAGGVFTGKVFGQPFKGRKRVLKAQGKGRKKGESPQAKVEKLEKIRTEAEAKAKQAQKDFEKVDDEYSTAQRSYNYYNGSREGRTEYGKQEIENASKKIAALSGKRAELEKALNDANAASRKASDDVKAYRDKCAKAGIPFMSNEYTELKARVGTYNIKKVPVKRLDKQLTSEEIIAKIGGPDRTYGSCASLALAYIANKNGYDVLDYRGGDSRKYFSVWGRKMVNLDKVNGTRIKVKQEVKGALKLLKTAEEGKEYLFAVGCHAAIVRNNGGKLEYLELQSSADNNGWHELNSDSLRYRFAAAKSQRQIYGQKLESNVTMADVSAFKDSKEFPEFLEYINTNEGQEMKGAGGYAK